MIRVLEVLATLKRAGAESMVATLVAGLDRARFEVEVISLYDAFPSGLEPAVESTGVRVRHLGKRPGFDARMFGRIGEIIRKFRPHVIHSHSYVMRYVFPAAKIWGSPAPTLIHTVHNLAEREVDALGRAVHRIAFAMGAIPVAVSEEVADSFQRMYGFAPGAVVPNGVPIAEFHRPATREVWRTANGFADDELLFLSVARLEPQKNPLLLVNAFERLGFGRLLLAGEGSLRPALKGRARVHMLGVRLDTVALLNACDVFAMASDWEGHPIALIEAMAAGLPVVATSVGGVPGIIGDAGLLVAPGDTAGMEAALRKLGEDRGRRMELGAAARVRAARFDARQMIAAYEELFTRVVH